MALSGPEKEISLGYNPSEISDPGHHHHLLQQKQLDRFNGTGIGPNSVGSKLNNNNKTTSATAASPSTRYRECLRNHAASVGGNVIDGCGEFMPSGEGGSLEALRCAACNCHRNFHRREPTAGDTSALILHPLQFPPLPPSPSVNPHRTLSMGYHHQYPSIVPPVKMVYGGGGGGANPTATESSSEELNFNPFQSDSVPVPLRLSKKRFRTKFTQEQKDKMLEFAEKVGWRIPREDDSEMQRFCSEVGVKRQVLKVWMHNNKSSAKKLTQES